MKVYIPYNQYRTNAVIQYHQSERPHRRDTAKDTHAFRNWLNSVAGGFGDTDTYSGTVTKGAAKRIQKAVSVLVQGSTERWLLNPVTGKRQKFKIGFITLTVSSTATNLTAKEAHKLLLEPFLRYFRDKHNMRSYIWKAELQKRGQIHYHLTTNTFIPFYEIRDYWNKLQRKAGLLAEFKEKYGHENPNSIDVHSVFKVKNLEAYLIKYLSKTEENGGSTKGKVWDCSRNLKAAKYFTAEQDSASTQLLEELQKTGKVVVKHFERFSIVLLRRCGLLDLLTPFNLQAYQLWKQQLQL